MKKHLFLIYAALLAACTLFVGCEKDSDGPKAPSIVPDDALFVVNAGNWGSSNASLTIYDPATQTVQNEAFTAINGYKLGDTAQSMTINDNTGWIVVNNSHILFAVDLKTMKEKGRITGIHSPRYLCFVSDTKAYVSQMYSNKLTIINPKTYEITGTITCPGMEANSGSTEEMVYDDGYLYVSCWSYQKRILKIDTRTDKVVGEVEVGIQPCALVEDTNDKLWTLCDGGYEGNPLGYEAPTLVRINPKTMTIEATFAFTKGDYISKIRINDDENRIYWLNNGSLYRMSISDPALPTTPLVAGEGFFYSLTVDPEREEIYCSDAIDYQQQGIIYRYSATGSLIDSFYGGIIPTEFCWN